MEETVVNQAKPQQKQLWGDLLHLISHTHMHAFSYTPFTERIFSYRTFLSKTCWFSLLFSQPFFLQPTGSESVFYAIN